MNDTKSDTEVTVELHNLGFSKINVSVDGTSSIQRPSICRHDEKELMFQDYQMQFDLLVTVLAMDDGQSYNLIDFELFFNCEELNLKGF